MDPVLVYKSDAAPNPKKFQKPNNYVKINKQENVVTDQVTVTSKNATSTSTTFHLNHTFTLSESLHSIMNKLLTANMITLPPILPLLPTTMASKSFDPKAFCQYHCQNGHDTKNYYSLKHKVQDLINSNALSVDNFDGTGNKYVSPPNQHLQIYKNPFLHMILIPLFSHILWILFMIQRWMILITLLAMWSMLFCLNLYLHPSLNLKLNFKFHLNLSLNQNLNLNLKKT